MSPLNVAILAYPGCFASEVYGVADLLTISDHVAARTAGADASFTTSVVSPRRRVLASGEVPLAVRPPAGVDLLVVPGFELAPGVDVQERLATLTLEVATIRDHADRGLPVVSVCVGAFLLGAAGLLDGRRATTAWLYAPELARRYPLADVASEELVVTDRGVTTAAAFSAMYDAVLDLVGRQCGTDVARRAARITLLDDARSGQTPYVDEDLLPTTGTEFEASVRRWLDQHLAEPYDLQRLAAACHLSTRTLLRHFRQATGQSPRAYLLGARARRARVLLEQTDQSIGEIHRSVGYTDPGAFRTLFIRHVGLSPRDYRASFRQSAARRPTQTPTQGVASGHPVVAGAS